MACRADVVCVLSVLALIGVVFLSVVLGLLGGTARFQSLNIPSPPFNEKEAH